MKKMPVILMALVTVISGLGVPVPAYGMEMGEEISEMGTLSVGVEANRIEDAQLIFVRIDPEWMYFKYRFAGEESKLVLSRLVLATYKEDEYSQKTVELRLDELDDQWPPEWAQGTKMAISNISDNYHWERDLKIAQEGFLDNAPGVLYYAAYIRDYSGATEDYWVRGKLDYRDCMYPSTGGVHACGVEMTNGQYEFERGNQKIRERDNIYESWGDELRAKLDEQLATVGEGVAEWNGEDPEIEGELRGKLVKIEELATDAAAQGEVRDKVAELERGMAQKKRKLEVEGLLAEIIDDVEAWGGDATMKEEILADFEKMDEILAEIGAEGTDLAKRVEEIRAKMAMKIKEHELNTDDNENGNGNNNGSGSSSGATVGGGTGMGSGLGGVAIEKPKEPTIETGTNKGELLGDVNSSNVQIEGSTVDNNVKNDQRSVSDDIAEEVGKAPEEVTEKVAVVPALSEGKVVETRKSGVWWALVVIVLALGAGIWWVKRAFFGKKVGGILNEKS